MGCGPATEPPKKETTTQPQPAGQVITEAKTEQKVQALAPPVKIEEKKEFVKELPKAEQKKVAEPAPEAKKEAVPIMTVEKAAKPAAGSETKVEPPKPEAKVVLPPIAAAKPEEKRAAPEVAPVLKPVDVKPPEKPIEEVKKVPEVKEEPAKAPASDPLKVLAQMGYKIPKTQIEEDTEPVHAVHSMMYAGAVRVAAGAKPAEGHMPPATTVMAPTQSEVVSQLPLPAIQGGAVGRVEEIEKGVAEHVVEQVEQMKGMIVEPKKSEPESAKPIEIPAAAKANA